MARFSEQMSREFTYVYLPLIQAKKRHSKNHLLLGSHE